MKHAKPNADPAVQAAYAAYLAAWVDVANLPGVSEQSASQAATAQEVQYRLYEAAKAHYEACRAVDNGIPVMTAADWQANFPLLNMEHPGEPTLYDLGLAERYSEPEIG